MTENTGSFPQRIFSKTPLGAQEMAARSLGLTPLQRRVLILLDGKRSLADVAVLVPGHDVAALVEQLVAHACVVYSMDAPGGAPVTTERTNSPVQPGVVPGPSAGTQGAPVSPALALAQLAFDALPPAASRSAKDVEMARNFMTNTINRMFEQYSKLTLVEAIFSCKDADDLRRVYPDWAHTMQTNTIAARRFPELSSQLFTTL